jgi:hypothetical protein
VETITLAFPPKARAAMQAIIDQHNASTGATFTVETYLCATPALQDHVPTLERERDLHYQAALADYMDHLIHSFSAP